MTSDSPLPNSSLIRVVDLLPQSFRNLTVDSFVSEEESKVKTSLTVMIHWTMKEEGQGLQVVKRWINMLLEALKCSKRYQVLIDVANCTIEKVGFCE